jgi:hypothetical protein
METIVILMSIGALGNYLSKGNKNPRMQGGTGQGVSENDEPTGEKIIYEQNRVAQVEKEMLNRATQKYGAHIKHQFPLDYQQPQSVVPNANFAHGGYPAPIEALGNASVPSVEKQFTQQRREWTQTQPNTMTPVDPQTAQPIPLVPAEDRYGGSLFREQTNFKNPPTSGLIEQFTGPLSGLSGLPFDPTHANMQPHFKGSNQRHVTDDFAQMTLERFTGSDLGQGSYIPKGEQPASWNGPQDIVRVTSSNLDDMHERAKFAADERSKFNHVTTTSSFRDKQIDFSKLQAPTKTIDELFPRRGVAEFAGRTGPQRTAQDRPLVGVMDKEYVPRGYEAQTPVGNRSVRGSVPVIPTPEVRDNRYTSTFENTWQGPKVSQTRGNGQEQAHDAIIKGAEGMVRRKNDVYTLPVGIATGKGMPRSTGVFNLNTTEKDVENQYITPAFKGKGAKTREGVHAPDTTIKETLDVSTLSGKGNRIDKTKGGYTEVNFDLPMTNKAMNAENKYMGPAFKNLGQGIRQHGIVALSTLKEMLHHEYLGPASNVKPRDKMNGEILDGFGAQPVLEDYVHNANRITNESKKDLGEFAEGNVKDLTTKLDFGGRFGAPLTTGPKSQQYCGEVEIGPNRSAEGRLSVGVQYSSDQRPCTDVSLKKETDQTVQFGNARATDIGMGHPGILVKTQNTESLNPRLDPDTRITSDLYPWLNCSTTSTPIDTGLEGVVTVPAIDSDFDNSFIQ